MFAQALPLATEDGVRVLEFDDSNAHLLQALFEANPLYFETVHGEAVQANQAHEEIHDKPPTGWAYTRMLVLGFQDRSGALIAMVNVIADLLVKGVWHIGTFIVATERHGTGDAQALYANVEVWARSNGARWMRLGAVASNPRAQRFWEGRGYGQVRTRENIAIGKLSHTVNVMVKSLYDQPTADYLALMERDRPESP